MARKLVHILNGDGMSEAFKDSGIPCDEIIIWREGLALGPVDLNILNEESLTRRKLFWETYSNIEGNLPDYYKFALPQLVKVATLKNSTVFLWFEHDLFCQINMLFAISLIDQTSDNHIFLVSTDSFSEVEDFKGYGQLNPDQLVKVFENSTTRLSMKDIEFALEILSLYVDKLPFPLEKSINKEFPDNLSLLKPALYAHLKRFPNTENGLGYHELSFLEKIRKKSLTKKQLIRSSLLSDSVFGFGDLEFFKILENLINYIDYNDDRISLNENGRNLIKGEVDYWDTEHAPKWIGGTMISNKSNNIRWDSSSNKLTDTST